MWPGTTAPTPDATGGRMSIFDNNGKLLALFGGGTNPGEPGDFFAPHDIWLDSKGSIYLAEVVWSANSRKPPATGKYHTLQKFEVMETK